MILYGCLKYRGREGAEATAELFDYCNKRPPLRPGPLFEIERLKEKGNDEDKGFSSRRRYEGFLASLRPAV
jgi:hypothetical protein